VKPSSGWLLLAGLAGAPRVMAAPPGVVTVVPAGSGQAMLAVGYDEKDELRVALCSQTPCSVAGGVALGLPRDLAPKSVADRSRTQLAPLLLRAGRRALHVRVPSANPERSFEAIVAAPLAGNAPLVLFAGLTGLAEGEDGVRHGGYVSVGEPDDDGARRVVIGKRLEEVAICGRPTPLEIRLVAPADLTLKPGIGQRLSGEEIAAAPKLTAVRLPPDAAPTAPLLRAVRATSAIGDPAALTDGNPETTWAENKSGAGRGEFVLFNARADMPLDGIEFTVRPPKASPPPSAIAPRELFVATTKALFSVTLPDDGWMTPGSRYAVRFPTRVQDDCVAVVLESAFVGKADGQVTLAEVNVRAAIEDSNLPALVAALRGGGQKAESAKAVLSMMGPPAFEAVAAAFVGLDEGGRRVALQVLDGAPCEISTPPYVEALGGPYPAHRTHAVDHLPKCGAVAAPLLAARLRAAKGAAFAELASQIAVIAPAQALSVFMPLMTERAADRRTAMRTAIGRLGTSREAEPSLRRALADPATPDVALLDILRALGSRAPALAPESLRALDRIATPGSSFRLRYLGVGPLAELSAASPRAHSALERALIADPDPRVRAAAAHAIRDAAPFQLSLVRALTDDSMRVRLEATQALATAPTGHATTALLARLDTDPWPSVRALAATALAGAQRSTTVDARLALALGDDAWLVRRDAIGALGARGARAHGELVLERFDDEEEWPAVRRSAAAALGELCHAPALESLTKHAHRLADPYASADQRSMAFAALGALRTIAPRDLATRLGPLLKNKAPAGARTAARAALNEQSTHCRPRR